MRSSSIAHTLMPRQAAMTPSARRSVLMDHSASTVASGPAATWWKSKDRGRAQAKDRRTSRS